MDQSKALLPIQLAVTLQNSDGHKPHMAEPGIETQIRRLVYKQNQVVWLHDPAFWSPFKTQLSALHRKLERSESSGLNGSELKPIKFL